MLTIPKDLIEKYKHYLDILCQWNNRINLVADSHNLEHLWQRHIIDCYRLVDIKQDRYINHLTENVTSSCIDMGAGAGFPGIVLAIALPETRFYLIDSHHKKTAFLHNVCLHLNLRNVVIMNNRIEKTAPFFANKASMCIVARALASLDTLLSYCALIGNEHTPIFFLKSRHNIKIEIEQAMQSWQFVYEIIDNPQWQKSGYGIVLMIKFVCKRRNELCI